MNIKKIVLMGICLALGFVCLRAFTLNMLIVRVDPGTPILVVTWPLDEPVCPAAGCTSVFYVTCSAENLLSLMSTNECRLEYTTNLTSPVWKPYPSPRAQYRFNSTNSVYLLPFDLQVQSMFFRTVAP